MIGTITLPLAGRQIQILLFRFFFLLFFLFSNFCCSFLDVAGEGRWCVLIPCCSCALSSCLLLRSTQAAHARQELREFLVFMRFVCATMCVACCVSCCCGLWGGCCGGGYQMILSAHNLSPLSGNCYLLYICR